MELMDSVSKSRCGAPWTTPSTIGQDQFRNICSDAGVPCFSKTSCTLSQHSPSRYWSCRGSVHAINLSAQRASGWREGLPSVASRRTSHQRRHILVAQALKINRSSTLEPNELERGNDDDEVCPLECVKEIYSQDELQHHLDEAGPNSLVVVDFFRTACGSCKYIEKGFMKLCKGESKDEEEGGQHHVVFLKHNVMNEYDEQSDIAEDLRIKVVPLFHFYKGGKLVDSFATRDKNRLLATIYRHTNRESEISKLSQA
ncbi:hypothetical protein KFL_011640010 [Klebsormidium nitens]|uniref:Thioredoxin domain-containing protein n=1 Tax=Klebsormidium nitens TaxID=105231 RepID=A0A1Y1IQ96_KLENI|nr:hypothetical protein KFL_011640010 [Klebsormidium nitens]|eukprot:GAQ92843.1 hypothetical protein KFL_011640010 [Klebsormidium nitens]